MMVVIGCLLIVPLRVKRLSCSCKNCFLRFLFGMFFQPLKFFYRKIFEIGSLEIGSLGIE